MILQDLHTHTVFCDGKNTPEEMARAAVEKGLARLGFSGHSYTSFDGRYCMTDYKPYIAAVRAAAEKFAGKIEILCGLEQDFYSPPPEGKFDYIIGSVHYIRFGTEYVEVDDDAGLLTDAADRFCGGDIYTVCERYYETLAGLYDKTKCDIVGHFDIITKFNEGAALFDEKNPRYRAAWQRAADALLNCGAAFEVNTGAIARGYRSEPYPSAEICEYLKSRGAKLILSSDAHSTDGICYEFDKWKAIL